MGWISADPVRNSPFWTVARLLAETLHSASTEPWWARFAWVNLGEIGYRAAAVEDVIYEGLATEHPGERLDVLNAVWSTHKRLAPSTLAAALVHIEDPKPVIRGYVINLLSDLTPTQLGSVKPDLSGTAWLALLEWLAASPVRARSVGDIVTRLDDVDLLVGRFAAAARRLRHVTTVALEHAVSNRDPGLGEWAESELRLHALFEDRRRRGSGRNDDRRR